MPSLDKSRSLVREASLNIFQPSEKKGKPCLVQHADNNAARKRKSATVVNGRRPYYRTRQYRIELIELTWVAKFISRFLLAVTRRGGGQGENIRESLLLLPTELLLLGQERKGGGKKRGNGEGEWNWPLATRLISDVARLFKGGKRAVLLDIAPFHCESFLFLPFEGFHIDLCLSTFHETFSPLRCTRLVGYELIHDQYWNEFW